MRVLSVSCMHTKIKMSESAKTNHLVSSRSLVFKTISPHVQWKHHKLCSSLRSDAIMLMCMPRTYKSLAIEQTTK
jgi:hypothetical protein